MTGVSMRGFVNDAGATLVVPAGKGCRLRHNINAVDHGLSERSILVGDDW